MLALAALSAVAACRPRLAWAQSGDMSAFGRTMRSLRIWWNNLTREPDEGDLEASDTVRFVAPVPPNPRTWSNGGITLTWIGHSSFLINLEGTTILTDLQREGRVQHPGPWYARAPAVRSPGAADG